MEKIKWPIILVTSYNLFYQLTPAMGFSDNIIMMMFVFAPVLVFWMVYKILKDGVPSNRTFDKYFYDDIDYKRNTAGNIPGNDV